MKRTSQSATQTSGLMRISSESRKQRSEWSQFLAFARREANLIHRKPRSRRSAWHNTSIRCPELCKVVPRIAKFSDISLFSLVQNRRLGLNGSGKSSHYGSWQE